MLHAVDDKAKALGLRRGQTHAAARAIVPDLVSATAEPEQAARALTALALWFERFSPSVAIDAAPPGTEGLILDMTGAAHLFGGEAALLEEIAGRLDRAGIPARLAMADTVGAAWGLARYGDRSQSIAPPGQTRQALADLPVEALRLEPDAVRLLARFGLRRIGDLYALPRAGLARRFRGEAGLALVRRLDQALGAEAEPLTGEHPPTDYRVWQSFVEPLIEAEGVGFVLPALAQALAAQLERDGMGARQLALDAFRTDGRRVRLAVGLSAPSRAPAHLLRLLKDKGIEHLDLGFGADALMLSAVVAEPLVPRQAALTTGAADPAASGSAEVLAGLIDRLRAKLGEGAVRRPAPFESHLPERSERWLRAGPQAPGGPVPDHGRPRPLLLFEPPEVVETLAEWPDAAPSRFVWRRVAHRVVKAEGPERLSPEWWRAPAGPHDPRTRDYYAVEDQAGRRFWLFREGLYDRDEEREAETVDAQAPKIDKPQRLPTWRLQGVFA